ncbi:MAG: flagellar biosynthetic protein FliR [Myxococcales bacterium]|nr:flagellar biosynthetic protein FliR [Myxococcales bacterium]MCB9644536.1 flagellar biosynthetic protein FliR [Myxococcales bacterium]
MEELSRIVSGLNLSEPLIIVGLMMARILGMIWLAPFLGGKLVPAQVKIGVGFALGVLMYPVLVEASTVDPIFRPTGPSFPFALRFIGYVVKETFVGFILGFIILTIWHIAEMVGRFVDTARGSAMGSSLVPQMQASVSQLGTLYYQLLIIVFFAVDGHLLFIEYFMRSYLIIPFADFPRFDTGLWPLFELIGRMTSHLFYSALTLSAPIMIAIFITDMCMGLFNKVAPQLNVMFLMMPFKAMLGVLFAMLSLFLLVQQSEIIMAKTLQQLWTIIQYLRPF